ncbi:heme oxygenase 2 [Cryptococcus gattii Ru294]|nr:heme oxygenase 2 [Cryptococcus gattii Ru294]
MQTAVSDKELHINSDSPTPLDTPSFRPNTPPFEQPAQSSAKVTEPGVDGLPELDLRKPISLLLKLGTKRAHIKAEHSAGAAALVQGDLGLEEYIRWLAALWRIYNALELGLQENSTNPVLAPTYDPALLARAAPLAADINYLLTLLPKDKDAVETNVSLKEPATPLPPFPLPSFIAPLFNDPPKPLANYLSHVRTLSASHVTAPGLLAHAYVRYLGDLSGGQFIGARVKKSFDLPGDDGTRFYQFDFQKGGNAQGEETRAETKKRLAEVKDWYRRGMDEAVGEDQRLKTDLVEEANLAFSLNTDLFSIIHVPAKDSKKPESGTVAAEDRPQTRAELLTQSAWFLAAAIFGVILNIYGGPLLSKLFA